MSGTGADPIKGISKSTVAEWNEQVRDPFFFHPNLSSKY